MLTIEKLNKSFDDNQVLKDIDLSFQPGETTVILGPSGSGKSTLLRSIDLLETPDSGSIKIDQDNLTFPQNLSFRQLKEYRGHFSIVFQAYNLFPHLTVIQNVMEGPTQVKKVSKDQARKQAEQLLTKVGLLDKAAEHPKQLSGGQMQRVAIARALAMEPEFMLYDEPTSALDPELAQEVLQVIKDLAESGNGQIVVTHHLEFDRKVADRIVFLEEGTVTFDGSSQAFFESDHPRIQRYLQQFL
ncbi:amino acid ABC transporter ATP-binding protein [Enterococcus raffinosus]|uniref:Amino acid ABC transporter ATP-binding protein n=1 Tax=Enterococcus raffinosus TaxID=71452 RepID=A0AAW8T564_9ENTE|nr:amino acid ABC transporter ATP-binding protein [Enterococcus raffinosus]MDT2522065.1 amino acid ABC transporter ATP-binding protein [Enterococcus raffinosus]MDT2528409.1 amino acid ABC transporter ATP-binding protein [Enterococcus raffinosus]MDT2533124.1 amino acid ABC transporter ATP-binding protein [Enterococcus raffinosus]MDT2543564.1 amino acid ABC transporter ATP-binding protein [Enterococcus raffinosus]MDT2553678.1 amino acid ABC transporter ATP-binding protein [Enterococcus raffinosu